MFDSASSYTTSTSTSDSGQRKSSSSNNSSHMSLKSYSVKSSTSTCSREIRKSKYERNDPKARLWWSKKFKELEAEVSVKPHEQQDVIESMFPMIQDRLKNILSFKKVSSGIPAYLAKPPQGLTHLKQVNANKDKYGPHNLSLMTDYLEFPLKDRKKKAPTNNPFRKFFMTRADRAAIWRELPPLSLNEMDLIQKADAITENIAQDFYKWLQTLGGESNYTLDAATIIKMFEIGFNYHAAKSLCVRIKELPAVTEAISTANRLPNVSLRANLHKHLKNDLKAFKTKMKQVAFGKMLPLELRSMPPKENFAGKWFHCKRVPEDLASMEAVWGGILHLRSTQAFCLWLMDHPNIPPPKYLVENGMFNRKNLTDQRYTIDDVSDVPHDTLSKYGMDNEL